MRQLILWLRRMEYPEILLGRMEYPEKSPHNHKLGGLDFVREQFKQLGKLVVVEAFTVFLDLYVG